VVREPVAAALTPDGKWLFVANLLPSGPADGDYTAATVSVIDTSAQKATAAIQLPNGSAGLHGICLSPDGKYAYITHLLSRYQMPTTQLERGWMNTNALTIIDTATQKAVNTVLLDDVDLGAANPWGVACTADGKYICVAHAGTHEVSVIDREALHKKMEQVAKGEKVSTVSLKAEDVPNDLSFLVGMRRRLKLAGNGPRGLAIVGSKVYVAEYFTDSLGIVDISPEARPMANSVPLGPKKEITTVRKGEMLFYDGEMCFQHWQSCGSCHPDARADGLNWDLLNDGLGNPKQTKSLLLTHKTPPAMMSGVRESAESAVRAGIKFILFAVRPEEDAVAIDEYLKSLQPVPSPHLVNGQLSESAKRGEQAFKSAGCASCHPAPLFTDQKEYNVGTGKNLDKDKQFDTPTLIENWRTTPYLYDGRAATMMDVLKKHNPKDVHGKTSNLTDQQASDLVEYILSQ
jgi:mono/diheme cytochrome c family protein